MKTWFEKMYGEPAPVNIKIEPVKKVVIEGKDKSRLIKTKQVAINIRKM